MSFKGIAPMTVHIVGFLGESFCINAVIFGIDSAFPGGMIIVFGMAVISIGLFVWHDARGDRV